MLQFHRQVRDALDFKISSLPLSRIGYWKLPPSRKQMILRNTNRAVHALLRARSRYMGGAKVMSMAISSSVVGSQSFMEAPLPDGAKWREEAGPTNKRRKIPG